VVNLLASVLGAAGSIVYVGFFAYKVEAPPLIIIVAGCLSLMVYAFYDDMREERANRSRASNGNAHK
jgi:hypothetical protein